MTPFCSILIATYGDDAWEELAWSRAYPSTVGQGIRPFDGSVEQIVHHVPSGTLAQARNQAAARAEGDWLCVLDSDDELEPGYIEAMHATAKHWNLTRRSDLIDNPCLLAPAVRYVTGDGREPGAGIPNLGGWPRTNECVIGTLVPRMAFLEAGGFQETTSDGTPLTLFEDYSLFLTLADRGAQLVHVPDAVYRAHVRPGSRNTSGDQLKVYDAIWRDHEARVASHAAR